jgi:hypothetical protein
VRRECLRDRAQSRLPFAVNPDERGKKRHQQRQSCGRRHALERRAQLSRGACDFEPERRTNTRELRQLARRIGGQHRTDEDALQLVG